MENFHTIVIGGGVLGCSVAISLKRRLGPKGKVLLVEKGTIGGGVSSEHSGIFRSVNRDEEALRMSLVASSIWHNLSEYWGTSVPLEVNGSLWIADASHGDAWREIAAASQRNDVTFSEVEPSRAQELSGGAISIGDGELYFHEPGAFQLLPDQLREGQRQALDANGVRFQERCPVHNIAFNGAGRVEGVESEEGRFGCSHLVNAARAWSSELLGRNGVHLPIRMEPVFIGNWESREGGVSPSMPIIGDYVNEAYFRSWPGGQLHMHRPRNRESAWVEDLFRKQSPIGLGEDYEDYQSPWDPEHSRVQQDYERRIRNRFPHLEGLSPTKGRIRYFDITPDHRFVLGADGEVPNLYHSVGGGQAMKYAPLFGEILGEMITEGSAAPLGFQLDRFSVDRFRKRAGATEPVIRDSRGTL